MTSPHSLNRRYRFLLPVLMLISSNPALPVSNPVEQVTLAGPYLIAVQPGSLIEKKLELIPVTEERVTNPLLTVTGAIMARLRTGTSAMEDRWQFSSVALSSIYADWQKASTEMEFDAKQLSKTRELTNAQQNSQNRVVERLRKLVATGTEAMRDLTSAESSLLQTQLEGQKAVFEAESALSQATHSKADLERRLLQEGIDTELLVRSTISGTTLVMADVPEIRINLVSAGQACEARFYGLPHQLFRGVVRSIAPALSTEHRTLRIFFELNDQQGQLKPGMYADIGLGMDPRWTRLTPSDAVLHIGESDYVLTEAGLGLWRVTTVQVGERLGSRVEILDGLKNGQKIVGNGAILLKPLVVKALLTANETGTGDVAP